VDNDLLIARIYERIKASLGRGIKKMQETEAVCAFLKEILPPGFQFFKPFLPSDV
jgi:hypothetical protein